MARPPCVSARQLFHIDAALNNSSTILLPFTVDPHGGIGPLASRFLFGTAPDPAPAPLTFRRRIPQQAYVKYTWRRVIFYEV